MITDIAYTKFYYGSTYEELSKRFWRHKNQYKLYSEGKRKYPTSSFSLFDEFGEDNCKIELVEKYPCESKEDLLKREGHYIRNNTCVNKVVSGRTQQEYNEDHKEIFQQYYENYRKEKKEHLNAKSKENYNQNREAVIERTTTYQKEHPEKTREIQRRHYQKHKDTINERRNQKYICECGSITTLRSKSKHNKTQKHQDWLKEQEQE